jgi:zinc ribbon protein
VYCPTCGSNNQDEVRFCTRCGTNLEVVSDALKGRTSGQLETDERTLTLLKDYYRSRRMMFIGGAASALALFKLAGPFLLGFPETNDSDSYPVAGVFVTESDRIRLGAGQVEQLQQRDQSAWHFSVERKGADGDTRAPATSGQPVELRHAGACDRSDRSAWQRH